MASVHPLPPPAAPAGAEGPDPEVATILPDRAHRSWGTVSGRVRIGGSPGRARPAGPGRGRRGPGSAPDRAGGGPVGGPRTTGTSGLRAGPLIAVPAVQQRCPRTTRRP